MRKSFSRILAGFLSFSLMFSTAYIGNAQETPSNAEDTRTVTVFHTNDMHGNLVSSDKVIGMDTVAALKKNTENSILVDGGDATQGIPFATLTKGSDVIKAMSMAGYDAMVTGNHEYDYGQDILLSNAKLASFPILASNVYKDGQLLLKDTAYNEEKSINNGANTIVTTQNGVEVGIVGVTTTATATASNPAGLVGITFEDEAESVEKQIDLIKDNCDTVIILAHLGDEKTVDCTGAALAEKLLKDSYGDEVSVIIDGHSHTVENSHIFNEDKTENILVAQTGTALTNVGKITLTVEADKDVEAVETLLSKTDVSGVAPDSQVTNFLNSVADEQSAVLKETIGYTQSSLWSKVPVAIGTSYDFTRTVETNFGDMITDVMADNAKAIIASDQKLASQYSSTPIVAVENGGGIRASIANGNITYGDIVTVFPYGNTVMVKAITPKILYDMLEVSVSSISAQDAKTGALTSSFSGAFLQVSGLKFIYNPNAADNKVTSVYLDGNEQILDRTDDITQILLATNSYLIGGGNGYTMLTDLPVVAEMVGEDLMLQESIAAAGGVVEYPITQNRILPNADYLKDSYTASIKLDSPLTTKLSRVFVDGAATTQGVSYDKEAQVLKVEVADGPHAIKLTTYGKEVLVDNYAGLGIDTNAQDLAVDAMYPVMSDQGTDNITNSDTQVSINMTDKMSYNYGKAVIPTSLTITQNDYTLKEGIDYTVEYTNNTNVGTATATITGIGIYSGTITKSFEITAVSIKSAKVKAISDKVYTGKAIKPSVNVTLNRKKLVLNKDYTVKYNSNKAIGTAAVTITGKGSYIGTLKTTFKINPKKVTNVKTVSKKSKTVKVTWKELKQSTGYTVQYSTDKNFKNAGTATVKGSSCVTKTLKLKAGKTYYIQVRSYKKVDGKKYYGAYSTVKKVTIKK